MGNTTALIEAAQQVRRAFGPPGDYGYGTKEGDALFALYRALATFQTTSSEAAGEAAPNT